MAKASRLNDTQLVLLTTAAGRDSGSLLPLPETLTAKADQIRKSVQRLIKASLATEAIVGVGAPFWREEDDRRIGVVISQAGRAAIGLEAPESAGASAAQEQPVRAVSDEPRAGSKQELLLKLIQRNEGAAIGEIVEATGWLAHTVRAAITGLRKRGHDIVFEKVEGGSRYCCKQVKA